MSCDLNTFSGKELLTNSVKEKLSILESEREKLRSLLSEVSNYEVTDEEKEWLLSFLLDKDFHLVNKELALRAIDNSRLARYIKNFITMQDACDSLLDGVTRFLGSALSQNYMGCVMLNRYLNEIKFIDVITHVPEEVLQALRGDLELLSTPIAVCLKDLIKFVGEGVVCTLFNFGNGGIDLVDLGDSLLIKGFDFKVVEEVIDLDCKNPKSIKSNIGSNGVVIGSAYVLVGSFIALIIVFLCLK